MNESEQRIEVIKEAETWLRTKYHHEAFVKGAGVDCAFLLICVYHKAIPSIIPWIDPRPYAMDWHLHQSEEKYLGWIKKYCKQVSNPQPGDIALFRFGRCVSHGAIVKEWPLVIHAIMPRAVEYSDASNGELKGRLHSFWTPWRDIP